MLNRTNLLILLVAFIGGGGGFLVGQRFLAPPPPPKSTSQASVPGYDVGDSVSAVVLRTLDGREIRLDAFQGHLVVLNFWATWCPPCIEEMPALEDFHLTQGEQGTRVIGVALDEPEAISAFLQKVPVTYPIAVEAPGATDLSVRMGNARGVLPFSVLIGRDGRVLDRHAGKLDAESLAAWIDRQSR